MPHDPVALSTWQGAVRVPPDYGGSPVITLSMVTNNTDPAKAAAITVGTSVVPAGSSADPAFSPAAYVLVPIPTTANQRFDQSFAVSTVPVAGATLNVKVYRDGANVGDTLGTLNVLVLECIFEYVAA